MIEAKLDSLKTAHLPKYRLRLLVLFARQKAGRDALIRDGLLSSRETLSAAFVATHPESGSNYSIL